MAIPWYIIARRDAVTWAAPWHYEIQASTREEAIAKAQSQLDAEKTKFKDWESFKIVSVRRGTTDHDYWREVWRKAYINTPRRANKDGTPSKNQGTFVTMCKLLDRDHLSQKGYKRENWISKGGQAVGHKKIGAAMERGSRPKDEEYRRKLLVLASSIGTAMAHEKLNRLGIGHLYVKNK